MNNSERWLSVSVWTTRRYERTPPRNRNELSEMIDRLIPISVWTVAVAGQSKSGHYCHREAKVSGATR